MLTKAWSKVARTLLRQVSTNSADLHFTPRSFIKAISSPQIRIPQQNLLSNWLIDNLKIFYSPELHDLLKTYSKRKLPSLEVAVALKKETLDRATQDYEKNWSLLFNLSRLNKQFVDFGINLVPEYQQIALSYFQEETFTSKNIYKLQSYLSTYLNLIYPDHLKDSLFLTSSQKDIFDLAEVGLMTLLSSGSTEDLSNWYQILRVYVLADKGTEDFRRALEEFIFSHISHLPMNTFIDLPYIYLNRTTFDYFYIMSKISGPYCREAVRRMGELTADDLGIVCYRMWWSLGKYGHYCDAPFVEMVKTRAFDIAWMQRFEDRAVVFFAVNAAVCLVNAGYFHLTEVYARLVALVMQRKTYITTSQLAQLTNALSRAHYFERDLWSYFLTMVPKVLEQMNQSGYIYSSLLQMKFAAPILYQEFMKDPVVASAYHAIQQKWKEMRTHDLGLSQESFQTKMLENYLKKHNCKYEMEYFDEYYIDAVLPDKKIAVEISGTMHYVLPSKTLNGKTQAKKFVLESMGWSVVIIPFFHQGNEEFIDSKFEEHLGIYLR